MTAIELMKALSYDMVSGRLYLQGYEISFIRERAKEEKLNDEEMEKLEEIIKNDRLTIPTDLAKVYDILDGKYVNLVDLRRDGWDIRTIQKDAKEKVMSKNLKFYKDTEGNELDILNYKINRASLYVCKEIDDVPRRATCWKKIFKDERVIPAYYIIAKSKYKGKYSFEKRDIYMREV